MSTLPALASVIDLEARMPRAFAADEMAGAQAALDDASALVRTEAGADWVDEDNLVDGVPDVVESITLTCARRALRNPDGVTQESLGSASFSYTEGGLYLTKSERRMIRRATGTLSSFDSVTLESPYTLTRGTAGLVEIDDTDTYIRMQADPPY